MPFLTPGQRSILESAVKKARKFSEAGAKNALHTLAVDSPKPFAHMSLEQRSLRNRLRSKGRLLGDELSTGGPQEIKHLSVELAYDYWHKMLFARFLEANALLIHSSGARVSLADCEELAKDENYTDKWTAAAHYASAMLPAIFRPLDPLMQVEFAAEDRIKLETILDDIENSIFEGDDSLGWVYQFWQSEAKDAINKSGDKIDGEKLPAVTQLFTEPYMVHFLIDNTIGAWWVSRNPGKTPPINFEYLRLLEDGTPAAGRFEGWPDDAAGITMLDPCMGSGHFVISVFYVLTRLRMFEENLTEGEATDRVITENLHGLEIDPRCTQIAAFNLALTAWKFCGHYRKLPEMNLACCGIAPLGKKEEWVRLVGKVERADDKARMENGMRVLYDHFQLAPELGSLLDPSIIKADAFTASFEELQPVLNKALEEVTDKDQLERGVIAAGIAKAGRLLAKDYNLITTNVPFLGSNKMSEILLTHCETNYPKTYNDLATVFVERALNLVKGGITIAVVTPHYWMRLKTFIKFRELILRKYSFRMIADLGGGSFSNISGEVVKVCLSIITNKKSDILYAIDLNAVKTIEAKNSGLLNNELLVLDMADFMKRKGMALALIEEKYISTLGNFANCYKGLDRADVNRFILLFIELPELSNRHKLIQTSFKKNKIIAGKTTIIDWQEYLNYSKQEKVAIRGDMAWGKKGIAITHTGNLPVSAYFGDLFDTNVHALIPKAYSDLNKIWEFSNSKEFYQIVRKFDTKIGVTNATFEKIPFSLNGEYILLDEFVELDFINSVSTDPTQWLFHGHPIKTENPLQVATARLLGYCWPAESNKEMELAEEARALINLIKLFDYLADDDGIICIPSVNNETSASERLREYLQAILGDQYNNNTIAQFLEKEGSKKNNLEDWLRDEFFDQHCKVFQNRPFIWHIWDGRKDGFGALVNYHKLTKENLRKLIYTYLGDWIRQCEFKNKRGESGSEGLLIAALKLKEKLEKILEGEAPFDIFVRWKPIEKQPAGWDPDLNDGVRLNIRPFITADVFRKKPNIKWGIDRGKNPPGSPWGEIRDNDRHLTLEEKRTARGN